MRSVRWSIVTIAVAAATLLSSWTVWAQTSGGQRQRGNQQPNGAGQGAEEEEDTGPQLPSDPRLLVLHKDFVTKAEKLAKEYETGKSLDKARTVYEEILKLVPKYPPAVAKLAKINEVESTANKKTMDVLANKKWQDTGIIVAVGKPIHIEASGSWTMTMSYPLSPNGMEIPEELKDFNLGSLVGVVDNGNPEEFKPFYIGSSYDFVAEYPGRLMIGMWDSDHTDNSGKLSVQIRGTFGKR